MKFPTPNISRGCHLEGAVIGCLIAGLTATACVGAIDEMGSSADPGAPLYPSGPTGASPGMPPPGSSTGSSAGPICPNAGAPPLAIRRLTRREYNNTVRDLLGNDSRPGDSLLVDSKIGSFDTNADPLSDVIFEQYSDAAAALAKAAVADVTKLLPCDPARLGETACARELIGKLGRRAYRRPLGADEIEALVAVYTKGRKRSFIEGIRLVVEAMLQSPHFLYRVDLGSGQSENGSSALDLHQMASRLSYFLWATMPDEPLFAAAASGELAKEDGIRTQVERMLADKRAIEGFGSFAVQWLSVDSLPGDSSITKSLSVEAERFFQHVMTEGRGNLDTLFGASFSFMDAELAEQYGVAAPSAGAAERTSLDPGQRRGVITQIGVLLAYRNPVTRGVFVREQLFCQTVAGVPPGLEVQAPDPDPSLTTRERFSAHRADSLCRGCHQFLDPIGFGFENYDEQGRYRSMESGRPVDARGEITGTIDLDGSFDGAVQLASRLSKSRQVRSCLVTQLFRFAVGRMEETWDECSFALAVAELERTNDLRQAIVALVTTPSFRRVAAGAGR